MASQWNFQWPWWGRCHIYNRHKWSKWRTNYHQWKHVV